MPQYKQSYVHTKRNHCSQRTHTHIHVHTGWQQKWACLINMQNFLISVTLSASNHTHLRGYVYTIFASPSKILLNFFIFFFFWVI